MTEPNYLTVTEAARCLRCHPVTVRRFIRKGTIKAVRFGRAWYVIPASLLPVGGGL